MYDKTKVYEDQILPLVEQMFAVAKEHEVQILVQVLINQELDEEKQVDRIASLRVRGAGEPPDMFLLINAMAAGQLKPETIFEALRFYEQFQAFKATMLEQGLREIPPAGNA